MICRPGRPTIRLLYLRSVDGLGMTSESLEALRPDWQIVPVSSIEAAFEEFDDSIDCILSALEFDDDTATKLLDKLDERETQLPVVLLVDARDEMVPAAAVSDRISAAIPIGSGISDGGGDACSRVVETIEDVVPTVDTDLAGDSSPDSRSLDAIKAGLLDHFFTRIPLHLFVKDETATHVMVSEADANNRIHASSEAYLGRRDIDGVVPRPEAAEPYADDRKVIETGEPVYEKEEYYPTTDRWFLTSKAPWERDGEVVGLLGVTQDITDRKDQEEQLNAVNHVIRHRMRNDLNVIRGWSEFLDAKHADAGDEVTRIQDAADRLTEKIDKQRTIVDIMTGNPTLRSIDVAQLVCEEADRLAAEHDAADIETETEPESAMFAHAPVEIRRAIAELIENAIVHSEANRPVASVSVARIDGDIVVTVTDECEPIPDHEIEILTGGESVDTLTHSSGFGLWMVKWILKGADGTIRFDRIDGGNEVRLTVSADDRASDQ